VVEHLCDRVVVLYLGRVMEMAPTEALFARPLHPYTRALLAASPKPDPALRSVPVGLHVPPGPGCARPAPRGGQEHLGRPGVLLKGDLPSPLAPPSGCVFRTRCPHAIDACAQQVPVPQELEPGRWSACIRNELMMKGVA
jgi:peptide/nickel transport system ATP-binding protein